MFNGNPMGLTWPLPTYSQPGAPGPNDSYAIDADVRSCPFDTDGTPARRVGSNRFGWLCVNGHQFDVKDDGTAVLLSANSLVGVVGATIVRTEPR